MKIALALALLTILLGGAFLLGHKAGTSRASADNAAELLQQAPPQPPPAVAPRPVLISGAADTPACAGSGQVADFPAEGNAFLSVRAAPNLQAIEIDRLNSGAQIHLCDSAQDESWLGIVYAEGGARAAACGVSTPISTQQAYAGGCRSGWVSRKNVQLMAG